MRGLAKKEKNGLKLIAAIVLLLIIAVFIAYFFWSWAQLGAVDVPFEEISGYAYSSADGEHRLRFLPDKIIYTAKDARHVFKSSELNYQDGIIKLESEQERMLIAVLSDGRLYSRADNVMLYRL